MKTIKINDEEIQQLHVKEAIVNILHRTLAGGNGAYTSEFGPCTLSILLKYTGFNMKDRRIIKEKMGWDVKKNKNNK